MITSALFLQIAGGDEAIAIHLGMAVKDLVWVLRVGFFSLAAGGLSS